jgi:hypothetical protein
MCSLAILSTVAVHGLSGHGGVAPTALAWRGYRSRRTAGFLALVSKDTRLPSSLSFDNDTLFGSIGGFLCLLTFTKPGLVLRVVQLPALLSRALPANVAAVVVVHKPVGLRLDTVLSSLALQEGIVDVRGRSTNSLDLERSRKSLE